MARFAWAGPPTFYSGPEEWQVSQRTDDGVLIHVRANAALKAVQARQDYPTALSVRVAFNISTERRAPTKLEQAEYEEIEEEISSRLGVCMEGHFPPRDYWP